MRCIMYCPKHEPILEIPNYFKIGNDYVNVMFESLQSNKSRIYISELFGIVITVSLSTVICITLMVGIV